MTESPEPIWTPQTIVALAGMAILGGTVAAVFWVGDPQTRSQTVGGILAFGGMIGGFYFGSSKGSQTKDTTIAQMSAPPVGTTTTVTTQGTPTQ